MSLVSAAEEFERWEKRLQGTLVYWVIYESTEDLHQHCPDFVGPLAERGVRGGFTPICEERLDEEFSDRNPRFMPFHAKDNRITWRYVFDQPQVKRSLVLDALAKQECRSIPDNTDVNELAEHCRVDAIADFAVLKYQCAGNYHGIRDESMKALNSHGGTSTHWNVYSTMKVTGESVGESRMVTFYMRG